MSFLSAVDEQATSILVNGLTFADIDVANILNDATNESNGAAAASPILEKVRAFGASALVCIIIVAVIFVAAMGVIRFLQLAASTEQTRQISKGNIIAAAIAAVGIGAFVSFVIFASGVGKSLFG